MPQVDYPTISVSAQLPGASPETVATSVAAPLERHLGQIADVTEMTSQSGIGQARITLQFDLNRDIDGAARDVQAAIVAARADLPASLKTNPTYRKVNPADAPILILAMTSKTLTQGQMYDAASNVLQQQLSQINGIGQVIIGGSALPAVRVELNPQALFKYGIGLEDVRAALASANANSPKGTIDDGDRRYQIYTNDQATKAADYAPLVIAYRNGAAVQLSDVASVNDSVEDVRNLGLANGQPSVLVILFRQPGANIIDTIDSVKAELPHLQAAMPADVNVTIAIDRSTTIRQSLHDTEMTLVIAITLVTLVVFLFLRDFRATLIPSVAVPVSILGTFGAMYLLGYSLDILSLMALTIATGFVVDDAIVVLENISRHLEAGMPRLRGGAARRARSRIHRAVDQPVADRRVHSDPADGRHPRPAVPRIHPHAVARDHDLAGDLADDDADDVRAVPASARAHEPGAAPAQLFRPRARRLRAHARLGAAAQRAGSGDFLRRHRAECRAVLHRAEGIFSAGRHRPPGRLAASRSKRVVPAHVAKAAADDGHRAGRSRRSRTSWVTPASAAAAASARSIPARSSCRSNRFRNGRPIDRCDRAAAAEARRRCPAAVCFSPRCRISAPAAARATRPINTRCRPTIPTICTNGRRCWSQALEHSSVLADVNSDQQQRGLESDLVIDRDTASRLGITPAQIDNTLYDAFGQRQVSVIYSAINQYHVVMEIDPRYTQYPASLKDIYVATSGGGASGTASSNTPAGTVSATAKSAASSSESATATAAANANNNSARNAAINSLATGGKGSTSSGAAVSTASETMVPLSAISHYHAGNTPLSVNHQGLFVASTISFNLSRAPRSAMRQSRSTTRSIKSTCRRRFTAVSPAPRRSSSNRSTTSRS